MVNRLSIAMKTYSALLLCIMTCLLLQAQDSLRYDGPYRLGDYEGLSSYMYSKSESTVLFNGPFSFHGNNVHALVSASDPYFRFEGSYENNNPIGNWRLVFGEFSATQQAEMIDYIYQVEIEGQEHTSVGEIRNGQFEGLWVQQIQSIEASQAAEILFKSEFNFTNGIAQQAFQIESDNYSLLGRFLRNGLAHDVWTLYEDLQPIENWHFNNGRLLKVSKEIGVGRDVVLFSSNENLKMVNLDDAYLNTIDTYYDLLDSQEQIGTVPSLLRQNIALYDKTSETFNLLSDTPSIVPNFIVGLPHYPIDSAERTQLDTIRSFSLKMDAIHKSILNNSALELLRLSDDEVDASLKSLSGYNQSVLTPIKTLLEYDKDGQLEYLNRDLLISKIWPKGEIYASDGKSYTVDNMEAVRDVTRYYYKRSDLISQALSQKLNASVRQQEVVLLEEQLMAEIKALDQLAISQDTLIDNYLLQIQNFKEERMAIYAQQNDVELKLDETKNAITCMRQLQSLSETIKSIPSQQDSMELLYTDDVWNIFTATVMEERVKKRILDAYNDILIPYFLDKVEHNLSCANAQLLSDQLNATTVRMRELRIEDTSKLERRLKKARTPESIMNLLDIPQREM